MAKAVADVSGENQAGFGSDGSNVTGFSHMHDSGTGGVTSLGNFPIFPLIGCPHDNLDECKFKKKDRAIPYVNDSVEAHPGYFAISLNSGVRAEMTVSNHTALYRFKFPEAQSLDAPLNPVILVELTDLANSASGVTVVHDNSTGRISGSGTFQPSFGSGSYRLHFCADFSGAHSRDTGLFDGKGRLGLFDNTGNPLSKFKPRGAFTRFHAPSSNGELFVRVGVSLINIEQACRSAETEIPNFDFDTTLAAAEKAWKAKLAVIEVADEGVSDEIKTVFWSGIYRSFISPQDYTGENPLWNSSEPYYDSYYCIWDSFRAQHPLITLMDPHSQTLMVRSLIDIYRFEGKLPDCRMSLCRGWSQGS
jgi:putative alpha-1,2-mannosidase